MARSEGDTRRCERCGAELAASDLFCMECGASASSPALEEADGQGRERPQRVQKASAWVLLAAIGFAVGGTVLGLVQNKEADKALQNLAGHPANAEWSIPVNGKTVTVGELRKLVKREVRAVFVLNYALAAIMIGLYFWARRSPLPALITALCTFLALIAVNGIVDPATLLHALPLRVMFIFAVVAGIKTTLKERRLACASDLPG